MGPYEKYHYLPRLRSLRESKALSDGAPTPIRRPRNQEDLLTYSFTVTYSRHQPPDARKRQSRTPLLDEAQNGWSHPTRGPPRCLRGALKVSEASRRQLNSQQPFFRATPISRRRPCLSRSCRTQQAESNAASHDRIRRAAGLPPQTNPRSDYGAFSLAAAEIRLWS